LREAESIPESRKSESAKSLLQLTVESAATAEIINPFMAVVDNPADNQFGSVEVYQETNCETRSTEIGPQPRKVNVRQLVDCVEFNQDFFANHQVKTMVPNLNPLEPHACSSLGFKWNLFAGEHDGHGIVVNTLQKAGAERSMNL
jgi:hypothetical protein